MTKQRLSASSDRLTDFDFSSVKWVHYDEDPRFDYPIKYSVGILGTSPETSTVDFIGRWAPNSYCHFHRHVGDTTSLILAGEHHTVETVDGEEVHKIRLAGDYSHKPGGEAHMEYGGPNGSLVFFSMRAVDGMIFDVLGDGERILNRVSFGEFIQDWKR